MRRLRRRGDQCERPAAVRGGLETAARFLLRRHLPSAFRLLRGRRLPGRRRVLSRRLGQRSRVRRRWREVPGRPPAVSSGPGERAGLLSRVRAFSRLLLTGNAGPVPAGRGRRLSAGPAHEADTSDEPSKVSLVEMPEVDFPAGTLSRGKYADRARRSLEVLAASSDANDGKE
jgi:hypothetical protein